MTAAPTHSPAFGFLAVVEDTTLGHLGGYLIVNHRGRPLEFHCTAPIEPTRAEEILFGATLRPHLYSERIGAALLAKASVQPELLVVNQIECCQLTGETALPVVLVDPKAKSADDASRSAQNYLQQVPTSNHAVQACLDQVDPQQRDNVQRLLEELARYVDLAEPFERVAEAIREASGTNEHSPGPEIETDVTDRPELEGPHDQAA